MQITKAILISVFLPAFALAQTTVNVRTQAMSEALVDYDRKAPAEVRALNASLISAEVSAVVMSIHADEGQLVSTGDILLELNPVDYQLNLKQAEANLASSQARLSQAKAKLNRARTLGDKQYVSADELLERETDVMVFEAQIRGDEVAVSIARRNLEKCTILAPFDGVVGDRSAQLGGFVRNGDLLLALTQVDRFELEAKIPDSQANELQNTKNLRFESRGRSWPVELLRLSPVIDREGRTRQARFTFSGDAPSIGRSGELVWRVGSGLLPSNLISRRNGVLGVFLHVNGKAHFEPVTGAQEGRPAVVDLPANSEVITVGRERLQDGMSVSIQQ